MKVAVCHWVTINTIAPVLGVLGNNTTYPGSCGLVHTKLSVEYWDKSDLGDSTINYLRTVKSGLGRGDLVSLEDSH